MSRDKKPQHLYIVRFRRARAVGALRPHRVTACTCNLWDDYLDAA